MVNTSLANLGAKVTLTLAGGDLSTLPTGKIVANPQLNLDLDAAGTDKTTRTGTLTSVTQTTALPPGTQALAIPVSGVDHQVVNINVTQQQITVTPRSISASKLKAKSGVDVTVTTVEGDLSKFELDTANTGIKATPQPPVPDGKTPSKTKTFKLTATGSITTPVVLKDSKPQKR